MPRNLCPYLLVVCVHLEHATDPVSSTLADKSKGCSTLRISIHHAVMRVLLRHLNNSVQACKSHVQSFDPIGGQQRLEGNCEEGSWGT